MNINVNQFINQWLVWDTVKCFLRSLKILQDCLKCKSLARFLHRQEQDCCARSSWTSCKILLDILQDLAEFLARFYKISCTKLPIIIMFFCQSPYSYITISISWNSVPKHGQSVNNTLKSGNTTSLLLYIRVVDIWTFGHCTVHFSTLVSFSFAHLHTSSSFDSRYMYLVLQPIQWA